MTNPRRIVAAACLWLGLAATAQVQAQAQAPAPTRVLFVGNSLVYVNNLPALLTALAPADAPIVADMLVAPGGDLFERWQDGSTAREINSGQWQVVVLQERGGLIACVEHPAERDEPDCRGSLNAQRKLVEVARQKGVRVILLGTWGPDSLWQKQLSRALRKVAAQVGAEALDAGADLRAFGKAHPDTPIYQDDALHPSLDGSLRIASGLVRHLTGAMPAPGARTIHAPLYPVRIRPDPFQRVSTQPALAGDGTATTIDADRMARVLAPLGD